MVSGCSCHFGGAPGGNATNVQRTRKQRSKGGARVRKPAGVDRARLDACIGNRRLYNARHVARICSQTHIKGVNPCREQRPDEHRPAPPARPAPPTRARDPAGPAAHRTGPRGRGPAAVCPGISTVARASRNARKNIDEDPSTAHVGPPETRGTKIGTLIKVPKIGTLIYASTPQPPLGSRPTAGVKISSAPRPRAATQRTRARCPRAARGPRR